WIPNLIISLAGFFIQTPTHCFYDSAGGSWCWISEYYDIYRISFHYAIILSAATLMIFIYAIMFAILYNRQRKMSAYGSKILQSVNKKLVWFPLAYVILVTPLAVQRIFAIVDYALPFEFLIISGCIFTCAGLVNSIIYGIIRNVVSVKSIIPRLSTITGIYSKSRFSSPGETLNDSDFANSFNTKNDLSSFISVTKTHQIRISVVDTCGESSTSTIFFVNMFLHETSCSGPSPKYDVNTNYAYTLAIGLLVIIVLIYFNHNNFNKSPKPVPSLFQKETIKENPKFDNTTDPKEYFAKLLNKNKNIKKNTSSCSPLPSEKSSKVSNLQIKKEQKIVLASVSETLITTKQRKYFVVESTTLTHTKNFDENGKVIESQTKYL
ncbi:11047_t:CDS:2, partial [Scutellospora calospora]